MDSPSPTRSPLPPLLLGDDGAAVTVGEGRPFALPTGTVTFLLTDVEGSTKRWEADPGAMATAIARHYEILERAISGAGGVRPVEQGEGDSVVGAFSRATDAVTAAVAAQRALASEAWPEGAALRVRMAVHTGEAQLRDEGNYFGQAIIRCARLRSCGWGGQVLLSQTSADLVRDHLGAGVTLVDLGRHRLKDLQQPEQVWQVTADGLENEFAPLASLDTFRHNLPTQMTPLVGRERELHELAEMLTRERVVTLTGSGGCGKTRLACELAARVIERFPGGVTWVELGPCGDIDSAFGIVASLLGVPEGPARAPLDRVIDVLAVRPASLLVLDNAEHLLDGVADLVAAIGSRTSDVRVVTTSREPLGVQGEVVWRVPSLTVPAPERGPIALDALGRFEAVQLFIDRARRARRGFAVTDDNAPAVAQICSRLDGVPLAIELAAARVRTMPPERIAAQLDDRFRLLSGGPRTALPRQQTLQASIAWSEELLDATERTVFARLGVFVGGFTVEAAEAVAGAFGDVDPYEVADVVARLADKSLLQVDEIHDRYSMLETVRSYALQRLMDCGETARGRDAHAAWFADWLEHLAGRATSARSINEWWERRFEVTMSIDPDRANCSAALEWLPTGCHDALRLVTGLGSYWVFRGGTEESARHGMPSLVTGDRADPAWLDAVIAMHGVRSNALDDAYELLSEEARSIAEQRQHRVGLLRLDGLAHMRPMWRDGPVDELIDAMSAAHVGAVAEREWYTAWNTAQQTAQALATAGRIAEALPHIEGLVHARASLIESGAAQFEGDYARALTCLRDCLRLSAGGRAPMLDDVLTWFRLEAIVLDTGQSDLLDELVPLTPTVVDQLPFAYTFLRRAVDGLRDLREANLERARDAFSSVELVLFGGIRGRSYLPRVDLALGDRAAARAHALELRSRCAGVNAPYVDAVVDLVLAECAWPDDLDEALASAHRSLVRAADCGLWPSAVDSLEAIGAMVIAGGRARDGARLLAAAQAGRDSMGYVYRFAHRARYVAEATAVARDDDGWSEGAGLTLPAAVDLARRMRGERVRSTVGWGSLTPTELAVVEQVTVGLTNPQIAERLLMGRATVKTHLLHVFAKLGVSTRAELVAAAIRRTQNDNER